MRSGFVVALVLAFLAVPAFAQSSDVGVWYSMSKVGTTNSGASSIDFDNGKGFSVSFNHFFGDHWSGELTYGQQSSNGTLKYLGDALFDTGKLKTKTATGIVQWHFTRSGLVDPYLGAGVAYVKADDLSSSDLTAAGVGTVTIDKKWGWAANAGVNLNITHAFAVAIDGKYVPYEPNSGATATKLKLNPTIYSAGLRFRF